MYEKELEIGQYAVIEAMRLCRTVQEELTGDHSITKSDRSPVTIADFASQAVICRLLEQNFPGVQIVGEESSDDLQKPEHKGVLEKIFHYIAEDEGACELLNRDNLFESIDLGGSEPNGDTFWTLDPIDGTKGFLRGEQFAVALALIVKGEVKLGILGCPNLKAAEDAEAGGSLLYAIEGKGAYLLDTWSGHSKKVGVSEITDAKKMRFVESYVSSHSNMDMQLEIARTLKMEKEPVRMDSQVKYAVVASGSAEIYLRIPHPKTPDYKEKIWDHAAGSIVVTEAGGLVVDIFGKKLDFSAGKTLKNNSGIFASIPSVHERILGIIKDLAGK
ncbi:MAG: 3'(2'),5'-bisphosphate nucleotidase [bacterium]|nr:3'(2'),5'-bisphosphate nucleotidase [bacterium]